MTTTKKILNCSAKGLGVAAMVALVVAGAGFMVLLLPLLAGARK